MKYKWLIASVLIILELGLCAGIVLVSWAGASQLKETNIRWRVLQFDTVSATATEEQRFTVASPAVLAVENSTSGRIVVTSGLANEIVITAHKTAWGSSPADAQAALASLKVSVTQNANTIKAQVVEPPVVVMFGSSGSNTVDLAIIAPITTAVTLRTEHGDMILSGTAGDADLYTDHGVVRVTDTSGRLTLRSDSGDITVERATASDVEVHTGRGAVSLTDVKVEGAVTLNSDSGAIRLKDGRAGSLNVRTGRGEITLTGLTARSAVTAYTDSGDVTFSNTSGDADLQTGRGAIRVTDTSGRLKLRSDSGDVTVERATAGDVEAHTGRGAVSLTDVKVESAVTLSSDSGAIRFKDGRAGSLDARTGRGDITLTGLTVRGAVTAYTDSGDVTARQAQAASYDLYTGRGDVSVDSASGAIKIQTDSGNVDVKNGNKANLDLRANRGEIAFAGSLGEGPHTLQTDSGNVRLTLPPNTALTFDLTTDQGQIKSEFPVTITGDLGQTHWRGTINGGGARLTASTSRGDISLNTFNP